MTTIARSSRSRNYIYKRIVNIKEKGKITVKNKTVLSITMVLGIKPIIALRRCEPVVKLIGIEVGKFSSI
jgi:hypothetical protein